jgi:hypothetical protein
MLWSNKLPNISPIVIFGVWDLRENNPRRDPIPWIATNRMSDVRKAVKASCGSGVYEAAVWWARDVRW